MQRFLQNKKLLYSSIAVLAVVIIGGIAVFRNGNGQYEPFTVEARDVVENVVISGTVEADIVSDLGFEVSGTVRNVFVKENDMVYAGAPLAELTLGTLVAELQAAEADAAIKRAEIGNAQITVENAWSELLSDDLLAKPESSTYTQTAPTITGRYDGPQGTYKLRVKSQAQTGRYDLLVFGLEETSREVDKTGPTALGTRGLYISFPDGVASYKDTIWYVTLPNEEGASYAANYSAYDEARDQMRLMESGSSIAAAELQKAEAEVARIEAQIAQRRLVAPFSGIVTAVNVDPGETVSVGTSAISLISEGAFGVEVDLPETDSVKVHVGDTATISLDALSGESFTGHVVSVNRTEKLVDNVSVYEARIAFDTEDERIASGMTAEVMITTNERNNVLAIPARAIKYHGEGVPFVTITDPETGEGVDKDVTLGIRGSDGFVEILSGVSSGAEIRIAL